MIHRQCLLDIIVDNIHIGKRDQILNYLLRKMIIFLVFSEYYSDNSKIDYSRFYSTVIGILLLIDNV